MAWTKDQQAAINARDCNLLVSAAAGSGKTAVLIERIIKRVTDVHNPIDIDSIVVVTFTRAAAEEMKIRLGKGFEAALKENPGNRHLIKQISLVDNAKITTIDSFCTYILRNYYNSINLEPDFRVAEEGELNLIKEDVLQDLLEEKFTLGEQDFLDFVEAFAPGKSVDRLSGLITGLHRFARSNPWPLEWLTECEKAYDVETVEEYENLAVVKDIKSYIKQVCMDSIKECDMMTDYCNEALGPVEYIPAILSDRQMWSDCLNMNTLSEMSIVLSRDFVTLGRSTKSDAALKSLVQNIRKNMKARREKLVRKFCVSPDTQLNQMKKCSEFVKLYLDLTKEFTLKFQEYKKNKNILDFSDIEHYALDILIRRENGEIDYTGIADELAESFNEIYIDEYQDSNLVQEYILNAVSRERFGIPNVFMVGDVKQSIYKFRMAKPELFMDKYDAYEDYKETGNAGGRYKIRLNLNFRSRENVLESINDVFSVIMKKTLGGIEYTRDVRLNAGKNFDDEGDDITELVVADEGQLKENNIDRQEACAHIAAGRIKKLMSENPKLTYRDFVILLRSDKSGGPVYSSVLTSHGIPSIYSSGTGYFTAYEVVNVLDFLKIIDNPRQEIALAGLMRSYFAYFDAKELAKIKGRKRRTELYDCVISYASKEGKTADKCRKLVDMVNKYRGMAQIYTIRELISKIIYDTGYYDYAGAMPGGKIRKANLDMLVQKAGEFEHTSYSGLFNFLRYIERLQKYDVDYGEGQTGSGDDNLVRIMSIHKSKGLEFPIVILGDAGKKYNLRDSTESVIYDSTVGIGIDYVDLEHRVRENVVYKNMIGHRITFDAIGEELRILYVAMTRAVDKLILIGCCNREKSLIKWENAVKGEDTVMTYLTENPNYLDAVAPWAINNPRYRVDFADAEQIKEIAEAGVIAAQNDKIINLDKIYNVDFNCDTYGNIAHILEYSYPYSKILSLKSKYSVSDLKHKAMEESELTEARLETGQREKQIPAFIREKETVTATFRGNAYHKLFELLDYNIAKDEPSVRVFLDSLTEEGKISREYAGLIDCGKIAAFLAGSLGGEMKEAFRSHKLFREQPFIMEIGADRVNEIYPPDEKVLVQGIIDAFYIKDNKVCIVDYKTDRVDRYTGEEILVSRYRKQLELYGEAISKITGMEVSRCCIYSVALNKEIIIN